VLVVRADERHHGDDAVRPGAVLHDHRLAPALGQALGEEARRHVGRAAGAERQDQLHRFLRPDLCVRGKREEKE